MEFLVTILSGFKQLQDISLASHQLDKDRTAAEAWEQDGWADYNGVSCTMSSLSWKEAYSIGKEMDEFSQLFLKAGNG